MKIKTTLFVAALAGVFTSAQAQTPTFTHLADVNLSSLFFTGSSAGDTVGAVAFDGTNVFVAGFNNGTASTSVGIGAVTSPFSSPTLTTSLATITGQANGGRDTNMAYNNGSLYIGTGLGDASASYVNKFNISGGANPSLSLDGTFVPQQSKTINSSGRIDGLAYDATNSALGVVARGRGFLFDRNLATGGVANNITTNGSGGSSYTWRGLTFDDSGDMYVRASNSIYYDARATATTFASAGPSKALSLTSSDSAQENISFLKGNGFSNLLFYSDRSLTTSGVSFASANGSSISVLGSLTGAETINGVADTAWTGNLFNYSTATVGGNSYLFVTNGTTNRLDIYEVQGVPEPASMVALGLGGLALLRRRRTK